MSDTLLTVAGLSAGAGDKPILHGIDLSIAAGETHVLMGPNGAGKSTLGHVIMGDPAFAVTSGTITFTEKSPTDRSLAGMFLSYQAPVEIPGLPLYTFLRTICQMRPELKTTARKFRDEVGRLSDELDLDQGLIMRELNVGFSGGEKKKIEMLQLLLLRPKLAILDETDSGLDVDALSIVSKAIEAYRADCDGALLMITHNTRILERLSVDHTHVMVRGNLVADGPASLIDDIDSNGFARFENELAQKGVE